MPPKRNKIVKYNENEVSYLCEWQTCDQIFCSIDALIDHVNGHLSEIFGLKSDGQDVQMYCDAKCQWRECIVTISAHITDYLRHIYFHIFHTKIKECGRIILKKNVKDIGQCALESFTRNLIPELPEKLCCSWRDCDVSYDNAEFFYRHVNTHAGYKDVTTCQWEGCGVVLPNHHRLKEHLRSHTQEKVVACPKCGSLFSCRTKFLDHIRKQNQGDGPTYQCSHCSKTFVSERLLRDHMRRHVNNYKCEFCNMTSPTPSGIKSHIKYRHSNERPFPCDQCNRRCKTLTDLTRHQNTCHQKNQYQCNIANCSYTVGTVDALKEHLFSHQGQSERYACHVCDKKFIRGCRLTKHLKVEHKYKWPSGHNRFRYIRHTDGYLRLQTLRYENVHLVAHITQESAILQKSGDCTIYTEMASSDTPMILSDETTAAGDHGTMYSNSPISVSGDTLVAESDATPVTVSGLVSSDDTAMSEVGDVQKDQLYNFDMLVDVASRYSNNT